MKRKLVLKMIASVAMLMMLSGCESKEVTSEAEVLDPQSAEVMALLESVKLDDFVDSKIPGYFYIKGQVDQKTMDNDYKLALGLKKELAANADLVSMTKEDMTENLRSIFGQDVTYTDESFELSVIHAATYDPKTATYTYEKPYIGAIFPPFYASKIISATRDEETIIIDEKALYAVHTDEGWDGDGAPPLDIYTPDQKTKLAGPIPFDSFDESDFIAEHDEELATYRYTFKQGDVDYYFESLVMID